MKCPVCPADAIDADARACPACGTDLLPVKLVREIGARYFNRALRLSGEQKHDDAVDAMLAARTFLPPSGIVNRVLGKLKWAAGDTIGARRSWEEAARLDPDDDESQRLIAMAGTERRPLPWIAVAAAGVFLGILVALSGVLLMRKSAPEPRPRGVTSIAAQLVPVAVAPTQEAPVPARASVLPGLATRLESVDGVDVRRGDRELIVLFGDGIFASGSAALPPSGAERMRLVAAIIASEQAPLRIVVRGHADAASPRSGLEWRDNWALSLDRAAKALDILRDSHETPRTWLATGSTPAEAPFPADPKSPRNRTITLTIAPQ